MTANKIISFKTAAERIKLIRLRDKARAEGNEGAAWFAEALLDTLDA